MAAIEFFTEDTSFRLSHPKTTSQWIKAVIKKEKKELTHLNFIFCSEDYLLSINQRYLNHTTLTDIVTFDNSDGEGSLEGDVFISVPRVKSNSSELNTDFDEEMHRVIIHGVLHLIGYSDKSAKEKAQMRKKEDAYLSLRRKS
ncbi:MAG TPA: rRNA maturation RNase YbeY [Chryseosolibacter sp.]